MVFSVICQEIIPLGWGVSEAITLNFLLLLLNIRIPIYPVHLIYYWYRWL